jgi:hypothetical protein
MDITRVNFEEIVDDGGFLELLQCKTREDNKTEIARTRQRGRTARNRPDQT